MEYHLSILNVLGKNQIFIILKFTRHIGFYGIFSITAVLYTIGLIYGVFFVKEPDFKDRPSVEISKKGVLADFFDKKNIIETFKVAVKQGPNQRRKRCKIKTLKSSFYKI